MTSSSLIVLVMIPNLSFFKWAMGLLPPLGGAKGAATAFLRDERARFVLVLVAHRYALHHDRVPRRGSLSWSTRPARSSRCSNLSGQIRAGMGPTALLSCAPIK